MAGFCTQTGKQVYDAAGAQSAARSLSSRQGGKRWVYACEHCAGWHLTQVDQAGFRKRASNRGRR